MFLRLLFQPEDVQACIVFHWPEDVFLVFTEQKLLDISLVQQQVEQPTAHVPGTSYRKSHLETCMKQHLPKLRS